MEWYVSYLIIRFSSWDTQSPHIKQFTGFFFWIFRASQVRMVASESAWQRFKASGQRYTKEEQIEAHRKYHELIDRFKRYRDELSDRTGDQVST